ncbi:aldehyde dehydrogenase domain-containing protein [Exophiala viscosa]|uniref:aldehyde dehydrogenase (NAD(+)) n=1 Tax=Exophiala viscosa TaxID=2486360 RepID=A0AAN6DXM6_9EURO|nr:aldehyde dehydrogenase domain-containing protein [Exophiala viscosa]KAI1625812.1 aldehyde dehydrogenase domain-containing protein [Exophiala viscosa]
MVSTNGATNGTAFQFSAKNLPKQLFINNEYVASKGNKTTPVYNPKDESLVADDVPVSNEADVEAAISAAENAFPKWKKFSAAARRDILLKFAALLEEHTEPLAELTRITLGAPYGAFGKFEVALGAEAFKYNAGWIDKFCGEAYPQENGFMQITRHEPLGVTAGIVPWNGPLATGALKAAPALATGNCFILKPSEKTPFAALALGPLIKEAGFPPGVFQILPGDGSTGAIISSHMKIRKVSFTGSIPTGKKIQEAAARSNLKRVTLELGGKSPAVIFDDCNLDNTVTWAVNAIATNTGQVCFAATRVYVQEGIYDKFVERYKAGLEERAKAIGDPDEEGTLMGPLVDKEQFERVTGFLERGASQGTLLTGGKRVGEKGFYVQPTVFEGVTSDQEIYKQEIFGPVAVLNKFKTEEEVLEKANSTEYGLMAGVFTQDINKALRVASEFDSGMVGINCISLTFLNSAFGGSKQSGLGRECGRDALEAFTEPKTIMINMTY